MMGTSRQTFKNVRRMGSRVISVVNREQLLSQGGWKASPQTARVPVVVS